MLVLSQIGCPIRAHVLLAREAAETPRLSEDAEGSARAAGVAIAADFAVAAGSDVR
jgi:hypothetical protein